MTDGSEGSQMEQPSESCLGPASIYLENSEAKAVYTYQSQNAWYLLQPKILWWPASAGVSLFLLAVGLPLSSSVFLPSVYILVVLGTGVSWNWRHGLLVWGISQLPDL